MPLTKAAAVVTIGSIHGGVRSNIIPESLYMLRNDKNSRMLR
jgi:amidohydrolase